jgi:TPR repeat protein
LEKSLAEALNCYRKAAERGHGKAQFNLGICYSSGTGVAPDASEAVDWFRKAAEQGVPEAQTMLACCYTEGRGVTKDLASAYALLLLSRASGDKDATEILKELGPTMTPEEIVQGTKLFRQSESSFKKM